MAWCRTFALVLLTACGSVCVATGGDAEAHHSGSMNDGVYSLRVPRPGGLRILFLGNSITLHGESAEIGWTNYWGMAASSPGNDYAHLVADAVESKTGREADLMILNIADFERDFEHWDGERELAEAIRFKPEVLVVAIGENVRDLETAADRTAYRAAFRRLLGLFVNDRIARPHAVVRGVFWTNEIKDAEMSSVAAELEIPFVRAAVGDTASYTAKGRFEHPGVAEHPGDRGMRMIAARILEELLPQFPGVSGDRNVRWLDPIDSAAWIWYPGAESWGAAFLGVRPDSPRAGVPPRYFRFCRPFESDGTPLRLHISADERYVLLLDGREIGRGPDLGTPERWFYRTYDLPLTSGRHQLEAVAWQETQRAPFSRMSWRGGFVLKAEGVYDTALTTGRAAWRVAELTNTTLRAAGNAAAPFVGCECLVRGCGLLQEKSSKCAWKTPEIVRPPVRPNEVGLRQGGWKLTPTELPEQICRCVSPGVFRGDDSVTFPLVVPAGARRELLWDLGDYWCGYPRLEVSGGSGTRIRWDWTESLWDENGRKGNRAAWRGKRIRDAYGDEFISDGRTNAVFSTSWWRCGRWCRIAIETAGEAVRIERPSFDESRYPFSDNSSFTSDDPMLPRIREICLRTLAMCQHETFMDCPFYEQQMYLGDSRVQFLTTAAISRDDRLVRQCLGLFSSARGTDGLLPMNFPSRMTQVSVPYTLCWVNMLRDRAMWRNERPFLEREFSGLSFTIDALARFENSEGFLVVLPGWSFSDYTPTWQDGVAPDGGTSPRISAIENIQYVKALQSAAYVASALGRTARAAEWEEKSVRLGRALADRFWDDRRGLLADDEKHQHFSELGQSLAVMTGILNGDRRLSVMEGLENPRGLTPATVYSSHFLFEAYFRLRRADLFFRRLGVWRGYVSLEMSTLQESPPLPGDEDTRSDCHAWGAHPLYHLQANVAGIHPAAPFFSEVEIAPQPGALSFIKATSPHPLGDVSIDLEFKDEGVSGTVTLPQGLSGTFRYGKLACRIVGGRNRIGDRIVWER